MRFSLQTKMVIITILVLLTGSFLSLYYTYITSRKLITNEVGVYQAKEAAMVKHFLEEWLNYATNDVMLWGAIPVFADAVTESGYYGQSAVEESGRWLLKLATECKQFMAAHIYRIDGSMAASSMPSEILADKITNVSDRDYFKIAAAGKIHISKIIKSRYTLKSLFVISAPIKRADKTVGVVVGVVSTQALSQPLQAIGKFRKNTKIFLLDRNNDPIISSLAKTGDNALEPLEKITINHVTEFLNRHAFPAKNQSSLQKPYLKDGQYVYVVSSFNNSNWKIIEVNVLETVEATIKKIFQYSLIATIVALFWVTCILLLIYRKNIFSRLMQLREKIQSLEKGNLETRITSDHKKDEISSLADSFNQMASRLQESIESLRASREQFQVAVDGSNDGIWDWDIVHDKIYLSPRWHAQLGYKEGELENPSYSTFTNLVHKEDIERVTNYVQSFLQDRKREFDIEFRMYHKDGTIRWIRSRAAMLWGENNQPYRIAGAHTDTTKEHLITEQLIKTKEEAETSNRYKSEFLANMSHEIRTPIGFITGLCYMIKDTGLDDRQSDYVDKIQKSAKTLLSIVNDILDFSKIEAGKLTIDPQSVNLHELLASVIESFGAAAQEKNINLNLQISPDIPEALETDPLRLNQIFTNLVNNAIKFTREGSVTLEANCLDKKSKSVELEIIVRDTGIGMTKDQQARIFKAFSQADTFISKQFGGTGLGLVISRDLLKLLGGNISVKSEQGKGTEFIVNLELPYADATDEKKENTASADMTETSIMDSSQGHDFQILPDAKVLLVEDNQINIMIAQSLLEKIKIVPEIALNGQDALEKIQEKDFDLILMDIQMPVIDGYTATRKIRALTEEKYKKIPIIAMTANAMKQDIDMAFSAGMNDHLGKPIEPEIFYPLLQKWLPRS